LGKQEADLVYFENWMGLKISPVWGFWRADDRDRLDFYPAEPVGALELSPDRSYLLR
jgi:hypothetical protein